MAKKIMFVSGKGGSGTTTLATNTAFVLSSMGKRVLIFDMNIGLRNVDIFLGMENRVLFDLGDVMCGLCNPKKAMLSYGVNNNLYLMPAPQNKTIPDLEKTRFQSLVEFLEKDFDYIIFDCPANIGTPMDCCAFASDKVVLVLTPDFASVRNTDAVSRRIQAMGKNNIGMVINKITEDCFKREPSFLWITQTMEIPLLAMLAKQKEIEDSTNNGSPASATGSPEIKRALDELTKKLIG